MESKKNHLNSDNTDLTRNCKSIRKNHSFNVSISFHGVSHMYPRKCR